MSAFLRVVRSVQAQPFLLLSAIAIAIALSAPKAVPVIPKESTSIRDMTNSTISIRTPATRVVMYPPSLWEYLTLDPDVRHVIAITNYLHSEASNNLLSRIHPRVADIPTLVTRGWNSAIPGDPEDVMRRNPDAVFTWGWFAEGLQQAALPVVSIMNDLNKPAQDIDLARWKLIAAVSGTDGQFSRLVARYRQRMNAAETAASLARNRSGGVPPTVIYLDVRKSGIIHAEAGNSSFATALVRAGGSNAARQKRPGTINIEQLMIWDPDIIILSCNGSDSFPEKLFRDPRFATLSAVRNKKVYKAPCGTSRMEGFVEAPLLIDWLAELFYPEQMPRTFRAKFAETYKTAFGYTVSDDEIDEALQWAENRQSRGFERFAR